MPPEPAYRHKLRQALDSVGPAGDFAVSGTLESIFPGLEVEGIGRVGLPLPAVHAEEIKACCEPAPFGKGEETRLDRDVRDTWQLDASKVSFRNTTGGWCEVEHPGQAPETKAGAIPAYHRDTSRRTVHLLLKIPK